MPPIQNDKKHALSESMSVMLIDLHDQKDDSTIQNHSSQNYEPNRQTQVVNSFCSGNCSLSEIIQLPDPCTLENRQYFILSTPQEKKAESHNIYEIQSIRNKENGSGSFFVGSRVITNGDLFLTSRVDPLFFIVAHINPSSSKFKWEPLDQTIANLSNPIKKALHHPNSNDPWSQLSHLFDKSDDFGDDMILYKFSETKTIQWLVKKFDRATEQIQKNMLRKKLRNYNQMQNSGYGTKTSSFNTQFIFDDETSKNESQFSNEATYDNKLSDEEQLKAKEGGLQVICEYLTEYWRNALIQYLRMTSQALLSQKERSKKNREAAQCGSSKDSDKEISFENSDRKNRTTWEPSPGEEEADKLLQFTLGTGTSGPHDNFSKKEEEKKKKLMSAQSHGLKRLNKANKKGMKSLASFFGVKKQKK